jgi:phage N-6-adenine-methyltransferase
VKTSRQDWRTPPAVFREANYILEDREFDFDVACTTENKLCDDGYFYDLGQDALEADWSKDLAGKKAWCNPPYNRTSDFIWKAIEFSESSGTGSVTFLIPSNTDTLIWSHIWRYASDVFFFIGRIAFIDPETLNPVRGCRHGSCLVRFTQKNEHTNKKILSVGYASVPRERR